MTATIPLETDSAISPVIAGLDSVVIVATIPVEIDSAVNP
jgi:hypothetical protein